MSNILDTVTIDTPSGLPNFDLAKLGSARLDRMAEAGTQIIECYRVLGKGGLNTVGEVLRGQGTFYEFEHYPRDDVFDEETHSQYYYHAHRSDAGEHGHFHLFIRQPGMPEGISPIAHAGEEEWPTGDDALTHLEVGKRGRGAFAREVLLRPDRAAHRGPHGRGHRRAGCSSERACRHASRRPLDGSGRGPRRGVDDDEHEPLDLILRAQAL